MNVEKTTGSGRCPRPAARAARRALQERIKGTVPTAKEEE